MYYTESTEIKSEQTKPVTLQIICDMFCFVLFCWGFFVCLFCFVCLFVVVFCLFVVVALFFCLFFVGVFLCFVLHSQCLRKRALAALRVTTFAVINLHMLSGRDSIGRSHSCRSCGWRFQPFMHVLISSTNALTEREKLTEQKNGKRKRTQEKDM